MFWREVRERFHHQQRKIIVSPSRPHFKKEPEILFLRCQTPFFIAPVSQVSQFPDMKTFIFISSSSATGDRITIALNLCLHLNEFISKFAKENSFKKVLINWPKKKTTIFSTKFTRAMEVERYDGNLCWPASRVSQLMARSDHNNSRQENQLLGLHSSAKEKISKRDFLRFSFRRKRKNFRALTLDGIVKCFPVIGCLTFPSYPPPQTTTTTKNKEKGK